MLAITKPATALAGEFCWLDLAATDAAAARQFYRRVFGWTPHEQAVNGGRFTRMQLGGRDIGSLYQLSRRSFEREVPSHWLPYVKVDDIDEALRRALAHDGRILVRPFVVDDVARIAVILDAVGAQVGLWEPLKNNGEASNHD